MGASILDAIIQQWLCTNGIKEAKKKMQCKGNTIQEWIKEARKFMLGVLNAIDIANLDHPNLIKFLENKKMEEEKKLKADVKKKATTHEINW